MIGIIYVIDFLEQKKKNVNPIASAPFFNSCTDDIISLFPDFNKRLRDIGIESR